MPGPWIIVLLCMAELVVDKPCRVTLRQPYNKGCAKRLCSKLLIIRVRYAPVMLNSIQHLVVKKRSPLSRDPESSSG